MTIANLPELSKPPISLEVDLPEPLFRRLQALLDKQPRESIDSLFTRAVAAYLDQSVTP